jgi:hypothetical protein
MKKQFIFCFCGGLVSLLSLNISFAQEESFKELPSITVSASMPAVVVSARVNKSFEQMFTNTSQRKWSKVHEKFMVEFIQNDQKNRALFTKNGELIYHISFGVEKNLPTEVRNVVKSHYYDQTITWVYKINQDDRNIWVVSMEDAEDLVMVRVEDMELQETQRIKKIQ